MWHVLCIFLCYFFVDLELFWKEGLANGVIWRFFLLQDKRTQFVPSLTLMAHNFCWAVETTVDLMRVLFCSRYVVSINWFYLDLLTFTDFEYRGSMEIQLLKTILICPVHPHFSFCVINFHSIHWDLCLGWCQDLLIEVAPAGGTRSVFCFRTILVWSGSSGEWEPGGVGSAWVVTAGLSFFHVGTSGGLTGCGLLMAFCLLKW